MKFILLRHGIAEDVDLAKEDALRQLTEKGRQELYDNAGALVAYLRGQSVRLITSPLVRAKETAEILTELGLPPAREMNFVATGHLPTLKRILREELSSVTVIVGHNPFLEQWTYALTDQYLVMRKASALEIEITDEEAFSGRVNWALPINRYDRLLSFDSYKLTLNQLEEDIHERLDEFHKVILHQREIFLREPEAIESVHKLRVKIRQFRSLISFLKPLMKKKAYRQDQDRLRYLIQRLAYLREVDVITKEWLRHKEAFIEAGLTGEEFLKVLTQERQEEQVRVYEFLEKPDFAQELNDIVNQVKEDIDVEKSSESNLPDMVVAMLNKWVDRFQRDYAAIDENDLETIHALRIRAKKLRYIMEIFGLNDHPDTQAEHKKIKGWQEKLGNITDANRNQEAVAEIAAKHPEAPLTEELALFNQIQVDWSEDLYEEYFETSEALGELPQAISVTPQVEEEISEP